MRRLFTGRASSSRSPPVFGSSGINTQVVKVNDSLYELHRPLIPPVVQIVLFHGLQEEDYSEAHLSTWRSEDGSCVWPKMWLAEEIPGVHVFSVSYSGDMKIIGENLLSDLLHGEIGQKIHCPVILVGHSIGGLVIKRLCQQAHDKLHISRGSEKAKYEAFLSNLKLIFFYSTPHHGSEIAKKLVKRIPGPLFPYFETLSTNTARLNHEFEGVRKVRDHWKIAGVSEGLRTHLGPSGEHFVVQEASARLGDFNVVDDADHFSICRPRNKSARSFHKLKEFVVRIASDAQEVKIREDIRLQEEARALENLRPENFQYVPKCVTGLDIQVQTIKDKLDEVKTLGLVGMGGLGKTTLAKEVFNRLAPSFEYTCFIPDVKLIDGGEMGLKNKIRENMHFHGKKVKDDQGWRTKPLLLVLDDTDGVRNEKVLSEMHETMAPEARIIFTTRNQCPSEFRACKVEFLNKIRAKQLFLSYAFRDDQASATKFERLTNAIIAKCGGLPLALEVLGNYLGTAKKLEVWQQTLHAMDKAEDHPDLNEKLWGILRVSYDGLDEKSQQIFLDAATFFNNDNWTLGEAKVAWRAAYHCDHESVLWENLVSMSLVYDVEDDKRIQLHEQLQSLGRKIVSEPVNNNRRREWDTDEGLRLLQNVAELHEKGISALRVGGCHGLGIEESECEEDDDGSEDADNHKKIHIPYTAVDSLVHLRYLEVNVPIVLDGAQDLPFRPKLVVLDCKWPDPAEVLLPALGDNIAILKLQWNKPCLPTHIGSFSKLKRLTFYEALHLKSLPEEFGNLSQLTHLDFSDCGQLQALPDSFGELSALTHLYFRRCEQLQALPDSFGELSALTHLEFFDCGQLQALPDSFGELSALTHLYFMHWGQLQALPESFGELSALTHLEFCDCGQLQALPDSFGELSALTHLYFMHWGQLQALPESFGELSALTHLYFRRCEQLQALPDSFGELSALTHLEFSDCGQLQALPDSFGELSALTHLEFFDCGQLQALPDSLGELSALTHLQFIDCGQLQALPDSFGELSALTHLYFRSCGQLQALPDSFGEVETFWRVDS